MQRLTPYRQPEPHEQEGVIPQPNEPIRAGRCPFLGTKSDPGTALAFPSDANHCNRTSLPVPVSAIHQETYCLSTRHTACPIYRQNALLSPEPDVSAAAGMVIGESFDSTGNNGHTLADAPATRTATAAPSARKRPAFSWTSLLILVVMLGLAFLAWQSWQDRLAGRDGETAASENEGQRVEVVIPPTPLVTADNALAPETEAEGGEEAGVEATAVPSLEATATPPPTNTATAEDGGLGALPEAGAETPTTACGPPQWWVRVVVESGDTVESLAATRGVPVAEVYHANCLESGDPLTVGRTIFLPPLAVIITLEPSPTPTAGTQGRPFPSPFPFPTQPPPFFPTAFPTQNIPEPTDTVEPEPPDPDTPRPTTRPTMPPTSLPTEPPPPTNTPPVPTPPVTVAPTRPGGVTATAPAPPTTSPTETIAPSPTLPPSRTPPSNP